MSKTKIIVLQHVEHEDLENIEEFFSKSRFEFTKIKLFKNQKIPKKLAVFSMMIVLGGPMDTWMEDSYPWLIEEKRTIKEFVVDLKKPFLGICLGCQLLGEVLGAKISKSKKTEIGFCKVKSQNNLNKDKIFNFLPNEFEVFQWHSYEVKKKQNKDFKILVSSKDTKVQLFKYKKHAYGMQFHLELKKDTIKRWLKINSNEEYLRKYLEEKDILKFNEISSNKINNISNLCEILVNNFSRVIY